MLVASRHGATAEIGAALAHAMTECDAGRSAGLVAVGLPVDERPAPAPFDAVVLGSVLYAGRWLEPALEYAAMHAGELRARSSLAAWTRITCPSGSGRW